MASLLYLQYKTNTLYMYVYGKARRQWQRAFFMFVQTHKKAALPIIKVDAAFLLLSSETVSRFLPCKDLLTLDLKYYEKNSL